MDLTTTRGLFFLNFAGFLFNMSVKRFGARGASFFENLVGKRPIVNVESGIVQIL